MNWKKVIGRTVIAVVVVGAAVYAYRWYSGRAVDETMVEAAVETVAVSRIPLRQTVQCTGRVVSNLDVEIKCRASGEIVALPFDVSDPVAKGDLLLELDPKDQERQVQQTEASLSASMARVEQAKAALRTAEVTLEADRAKAAANIQGAEAQAADAEAKAKREETLLERKFSSDEAVETARTTAVQARQNVLTAKAQLETLKAQEIDLERLRQAIKLSEADVQSGTIALSLSKLQLEYTRVYAPIDGVVSARNVQIGQIISSGISNVGGGTAALTISDLSRIFILASVDESDIGYVKLGQDVEITADSYPGRPFAGKVERIATNGVNLSNVVTFEVRIEVLGDNKTLLKPEMTTNVVIVIADKADALAVSATALIRERGKMYVALPGPDGQPGEHKPVEVGISDGVDTEIVSGLSEGEMITVLSADADSRWRSEDGDGRNSGRQRMMMMRTMGGGARR